MHSKIKKEQQNRTTTKIEKNSVNILTSVTESGLKNNNPVLIVVKINYFNVPLQYIVQSC